MFQVDGVEAEEEVQRRSTGEAARDWRTGVGARARLDAGGAHAGLLGGSPLTLLQGIIPGLFVFILVPAMGHEKLSLMRSLK